ncbi:MAG: DUF2127 domain-containing protein [Terracidiphilus sp.]|jgi:uncharacterized membrane protein (DUF2068 family)
MTNSPSRFSPPPWKHNKGLILIAAFKLGQALFFTAMGVGLFRLLHKDIGDVLERFAFHMRFSPESRFVNFLLVKSSLLDERLLKRIVEVFFIYAGLDLVEGIGLYLEKTWAEYLTLAITASFLPLEVYEVFNKLTLIRAGLLVINVLVFLYLFKLVMGRKTRTDVPGSG